MSESVRAIAAQLEAARTQVKRRGASSTTICRTEAAARAAERLRARIGGSELENERGIGTARPAGASLVQPLRKCRPCERLLARSQVVNTRGRDPQARRVRTLSRSVPDGHAAHLVPAAATPAHDPAL